MIRRKETNACFCGCGVVVARTFKQGHDAKCLSAVVKAVGGLVELRQIVETDQGHALVMDADGALPMIRSAGGIKALCLIAERALGYEITTEGGKDA